jgi:ABC-type uncharacterized transport system auxiliary subunit
MTKMPQSMMGGLLVISIVSCGAPPPKRYYTMANSLQSDARYATPPLCALPLVVASVMAASPYEDDKIVFRSNDFEIRYYNYRFWVDPPEKMMMGLLQLRMSHSGLFETVEYRINSASDHLALYVKLNAVEERDRNEKWYARLAMSFVLKTADNESVIWTHEFDEERPAQVKSALGVVATLSDIYNTELNEVMESLSIFLPTYAGCTKDTAAISRSECQ